MQLAVSKPEMLYYWQMTVWSSVAMHTTLGSVKALTAAPPHRIWGAADFKMVQRMTVTLPQAHSSTHIVVFPLWLLNPFSPQSPWTSHLEKCRSHWKACSIFTKKKKKNARASIICAGGLLIYYSLRAGLGISGCSGWLWPQASYLLLVFRPPHLDLWNWTSGYPVRPCKTT